MRCKSCNVTLKDNEGKWDAERGTHEDLCTNCLSIAMGYVDPDEAPPNDLYEDDDMDWVDWPLDNSEDGDW